jgi:hypothetical protein
VKRLPALAALLAAILVLASALSGCNVQLAPYAAVVNGSVISQQQLRNALSAIMQNASYKCAIESSGTTQFKGAGDDTYSAAFTAEVLSILIQDKATRQEAVRMRLFEPPSLGPVALGQLQQATTPPSTCPGSGASLVAAFPAWYRAVLLSFQVDEDAIAAHLAGTSFRPAMFASYVARHHSEMSVACVSVIETSTKATASSLHDQILHGASFAALARAHSINTATASQGGAIGCVPDSEFNPPLNTVIARLAVGGVSEPVSFSSDWLLLLVTSRQTQTYSQNVSSLLGQEQGAIGTFFPRLVRSANVVIDPQFGTWDTKASPPRVQANAGPPAAVVPNPGANTGPAASS